MSTRIKKDTHISNSINRLILLFIVPVSLILSGSAPVRTKGDGWVIVIDPGHGGRDPGAIGSYSYEKNVVLAVALKTGQYIEQNIKNTKVIYTRKTDVYVDLNERAEIANKYKADLFISIHANSHRLKSTYGAETYIMGHSKDEQNLEVAMKENEVMLLDNDYSTKYENFDPKSPESYIMFTLIQSAYSRQSTILASNIQTQFKENVRLYDRGVKQDIFWVLWKTTMPSVLTEIGFISNINEEKYINSPQGQDFIASCIYKACKDYISELDKKNGMSVPLAEKTPVRTNIEDIKPENNGIILYMVQFTASVTKIEIKPNSFKGIKDVVELNTGGRYRYATGNFTEYNKAVRLRKQIENIYPDAFVIAIKDNKILPLQNAIDQNKGK